MTIPVLVGSASLNSDVLVDSLVPDVIDGLRESLQPQFGVRAYRVYRVIRTWSGAAVGDGIHTDVAVELRPQPLVWTWETIADGLRYEQAACGLRELGQIKLTEVSLTYTEDDLTGGDTAVNVEVFIALGEANGQGTHTRLFTHSKPPYIDRIKDLGWAVFLKHVEAAPPWATS